MPHVVRLPSGHEISDDRDRVDMGFVHAAMERAYWAAGRPREQTERSWAHCLCFGVYRSTGAQVGCARLLTDFTFRAHLADVFIESADRGAGLGKALVETILDHPELTTVQVWTLTTGDAHGLYARHGFRLAEADGKAMVLVRRQRPTIL